MLELAVAGAQASLAATRWSSRPTRTAAPLRGAASRSTRAGGVLAARFEVPAPDRLRIVVDDAGAVYPLVIDPLLTEIASHAQLERDQARCGVRRSVAPAGDVNGDGYADVIVGARSYDAGQSDEGAAFVFLGSAAGIATRRLRGARSSSRTRSMRRFGASVASAGDVNGDGYADVIVGARPTTRVRSDEGAAFVFLGSASGIANGTPAYGCGAARVERRRARVSAPAWPRPAT